MPTLDALLREHRDRVPRTPCAGLVGGEPVTVHAVLERTAVVHPPGDGQSAARQLLPTHMIELTGDVEWVERPRRTGWAQLQDSSHRGRSLSARSPRRRKKA